MDSGVEEQGRTVSFYDFPEAAVPGDLRPLAFVSFARRSSISRSGGQLFGGWSPAFSAACGPSFPSSIQEGAISRLSEAGRCGVGEIVIKAEHS